MLFSLCPNIVKPSAGGDGVQIFTTKVYGVLVVGIRLVEAPLDMAAKNVTWVPLLIVQGSTEPNVLHDRGVLKIILEFFQRHDPGTYTSHGYMCTQYQQWPFLVHGKVVLLFGGQYSGLHPQQ